MSPRRRYSEESLYFVPLISANAPLISSTSGSEGVVKSGREIPA